MDVSIVIPAYNSCSELELTLDVVAAQIQASTTLQVIVVDDGSSDGTRQLLARYAQAIPEWKPLFRQRDAQSCRARARNLGAAAADGRWLFFLDAGILPGPGLIAHVASLPGAPGMVLVSKILGAFTDAPRLGKANDYLDRSSALAKHPGWRDVREPFMQSWRRSSASLPAPWLLAWSGALAVPREAFSAVGGFDVSYRGWGVEDVDLAARLMDAGLQLVWLEEYFAIHTPHARSRGRRREHAVNMARLHEKRRSRESELYSFFGDGFAANTFASHLDSLDLDVVAPPLRATNGSAGQKTLCIGLAPGAVPREAAAVLHHKRSLASEMRRAAPAAEHLCLVGVALPYAAGEFALAVLGDFVRLLPPALRRQLLKEACRVSVRLRLVLSNAVGHEATYRTLAGWPWASVEEVRELLQECGLEVTGRERPGLIELAVSHRGPQTS